MRKTSELAISRRRAIVSLVDTKPRKKTEIAAEMKIGPHTLDHILGWLSTHECIVSTGRGLWVSARLYSEMFPDAKSTKVRQQLTPQAMAAPSPGWQQSAETIESYVHIDGRKVRVTRQGAPLGRFEVDPSIKGRGAISQDCGRIG